MIKVFVITYTQGSQVKVWPESLSASLAFALGKSFAKDGLKPKVHKLLVEESDMLHVITREGTRLPVRVA